MIERHIKEVRNTEDINDDKTSSNENSGRFQMILKSENLGQVTNHALHTN